MSTSISLENMFLQYPEFNPKENHNKFPLLGFFNFIHSAICKAKKCIDEDGKSFQFVPLRNADNLPLALFIKKRNSEPLFFISEMPQVMDDVMVDKKRVDFQVKCKISQQAKNKINRDPCQNLPR